MLEAREGRKERRQMLVGVQTYSEAGRMWSGVPQYSKVISYQDFIEYFSKEKF